MPAKGTTTTERKKAELRQAGHDQREVDAKAAAASKASTTKPKAAKPEGGNAAGKAPEVAALPMPALPTANIAARGVVSVPIVPTTLDDCWRLSQYLSQSMMCRDLPGQPGSNMNVSAILAILQQGATVGLPPMSALGAITIIEGKLAMYGDGQLAVLMGTGTISEIEETWEGLPSEDTALEDWPVEAKAVCRMKRAATGFERTYEFSVGDAMRADLWNKLTSKGNKTTWMRHPKRMMRLRARAFCARDIAPDVLLGFQHTAEELIDITPEQTTIAPPIPKETDYVDAPHVPDLPEPGEAYEIDEDKSVIDGETGEVIEQEDTSLVGEPEPDPSEVDGVEPAPEPEPEAAFVCVDWNGDEHEWLTLDEAVVGLAGVVARSPDLDSLMAFIKDNEIPALMKSEAISEAEMTQLDYAINETKKKHTASTEPDPEAKTEAEPQAKAEPEFTTKADVADPSQHAAWYKSAREELRGLDTKAAVNRFEKHIAPALDKIPGTHKSSLVRLCEAQRKNVGKKGGKK